MYLYSQHRFLKPPRVLGRRLRPFCLGHADVLTGAGHPGFGGESQGAAADLALAVFVCSRPWKKAARQMRSGAAVRVMMRLGRKVRGAAGAAAVREAAEVMQEYFEVYGQAPPRWESGGASKQLCVPWHLAVFAVIQERTNFQPSETWNLPVSAAMELVAAVGANNGDKDLVSPAEMPIYSKLVAGEASPAEEPTPACGHPSGGGDFNGVKL